MGAYAGSRSVRPYYMISTSQDDFESVSDSFVGRLSGNLLSTQYELVGRGRDPKKVKGTSAAVKASSTDCPGLAYREELAIIRFRKPGDAPRTVEVAVPRPAADGSRQELRPKSPRSDGLRRAWGPFKANQPTKWQCLVSPEARWDENRRVYSMNFHGRVSVSSSKNF